MQQFRQVEGGCLFQARIVPEELQCGVDHRLHFIDVAKQPLLLLLILDELTPQAHAGQGRAQVMGDGREHLRAVLDEVLQLGLHGVESEDRLTDFMGPDRLHRRRPEVDAKTPCALGKLLQGPGQAPGGDQRDHSGGNQHQYDHDQTARPLLQPPTA